MKPTELPILPFANKKKFAAWLARQHDKSTGVWLKLAEKNTGINSVTYEEALDCLRREFSHKNDILWLNFHSAYGSNWRVAMI